jgi:predicted transcriptional regulator
MSPARQLRQARRRAGYTQRQLAALTGVAQPTIARIESGESDPRVGTLDHLLRACDEMLEALPTAGTGIDRTTIRELLAQTPAERMSTLTAEAATLDRLAAARPVG